MKRIIVGFVDFVFMMILGWILYGAYKGLCYFFDPDKFIFEIFVFMAIAGLAWKQQIEARKENQ